MYDILEGKRLYYKKPRGFQWWWLIWGAAGICLFLCGAALGLVSSGSSGGGWFSDLMTPPFGGAGHVSLLLVGVDNSEGRGLADTIMFAMIYPRTGEISVVSIPRDSRVEIPGAGFTRINASHSIGGLHLTVQTVETVIGLPVDHYVEVNVPGLVTLVDAIGGVDLEVEKRMFYRDRSQHLYIDLQPGFQHLNGTQAMGYVRFRHDAIGDFARVERQRKFMGVVIKKLFSPEHVTEIPKVLDTFLKTVNTDLTMPDLASLKRLFEQGSPEAIRTATLPARTIQVGGADMLELDPVKVRDTVNEVLLHQGIRVAVLNGTHVEGLASRVADVLKAQGCDIVEVGNAAGQSETTLVVSHGRSAGRAERVAGWLGRGAVTVAPAGRTQADVTVVVGRDLVADPLLPVPAQ